MQHFTIYVFRLKIFRIKILLTCQSVLALQPKLIAFWPRFDVFPSKDRVSFVSLASFPAPFRQELCNWTTKYFVNIGPNRILQIILAFNESTLTLHRWSHSYFVLKLFFEIEFCTLLCRFSYFFFLLWETGMKNYFWLGKVRIILPFLFQITHFFHVVFLFILAG